jgi:hypothetical protein
MYAEQAKCAQEHSLWNESAGKNIFHGGTRMAKKKAAKKKVAKKKATKKKATKKKAKKKAKKK